MIIEVKIWDNVTPFNNRSAETCRKSFDEVFGKDEPVYLVYKDGEFTGIADALGTQTTDQLKARYEADFAAEEERSTQTQQAPGQITLTPEQLQDIIAEAVKAVK